jgi:hypothetical protein
VTRKRALILALATLFLLVLAVRANAAWRGTDMWSNLMPTDDREGIANQHPISYYHLDYHVDAGITNTDGIPAQISQFFASFLFFGAAVIMRLVISVYSWAFNLDLITGAGGGLETTAPISQQNYQDLVMPFLVTAVICLGVWVAVKSVKRDSSDVSSALARVVLMSVVSIAIVQHPGETIGRAYQMTDDLATAIVTQMAGGDPADRVFETFVYRPWAILQFGGLQVCTGDKLDSDGYPVAATTPGARKVCHSVLHKDPDGHGDYARIMLRYAPGSKERQGYYDALREGQPFPGAPGSKIDKTDAPAVDMMQAGGAEQRLFYVFLIVICMAGGVLLLGLICIGVVFAQIALLLLVMLSGFMLLAAVYPGAHGAFEKWLSLLGKVLVGKIVYALMLGAVLSTSAGLLAIGTTLGYFVAFLLQSTLYLGVFFKRKVILEMVTSRKTAKRFSESEHKTVAFASNTTAMAAGAISGGATTFASTMREGWAGHKGGEKSEESKEHPQTTVAPASPDVPTSTPVPGPASTPAQQPSPQPAAAGGSSSTSDPPENMPSPASTTAPQRQENPMPRPFSEDLAAAQQRQSQPPDPRAEEQDDYRLQAASSYQPREPVNSKPLRSFEDDLELATLAQERPVENRVPQPLDE